jgi:nitrate/nitrite transporter NarK
MVLARRAAGRMRMTVVVTVIMVVGVGVAMVVMEMRSGGSGVAVAWMEVVVIRAFTGVGDEAVESRVVSEEAAQGEAERGEDGEATVGEGRNALAARDGGCGWRSSHGGQGIRAGAVQGEQDVGESGLPGWKVVVAEGRLP